jgi:hypothetical protein
MVSYRIVLSVTANSQEGVAGGGFANLIHRTCYHSLAEARNRQVSGLLHTNGDDPFVHCSVVSDRI